MSITRRHVSRVISAAIVVVLFGAMSIFKHGFLTWSNVNGILDGQTYLTLIALGITLLLILNEFDLSVGYVASLAACVGASTALSTQSGTLGFLAGAAVGVGCGLGNGLIVTVLQIPSFVATLAMGLVWFGVTYAYTGGGQVIGMPSSFTVVGQGAITGVYWATLGTALVCLLAWIVLQRSTLGRRVQAIGGNAVAARLSGVPIRSVKLGGFALGSLGAALGGVLLSSNQASAGPLIATGLLLDAFTAVFLGAAMLGTRPGVVPTVVGAITIGLIDNAMTYLNFGTDTSSVVRGLFLLAAIGLSRGGSGARVVVR
jgi:ribose/xylose/arabinose/galactoside ABC-type transport system permease subunit